MLNKFRKIYPKGSIVSQLIKIDRDKYIVRASVEVEGRTLATGLASAQTIEEAENRARVRALAAALPKHPSNSSSREVQLTTIESSNVAQSIAQPSALSGQSNSPSNESDEMNQINRAPTTPQLNNPSSEIIKRWYDQRDNEQDLKPVDRDRHLTPIDNDRNLTPIDNDRTLKPVDNDRHLKSVENDRHLNPVENDRTLNPVENDRTLNPVENDRTLNPVDNERHLNPVDNERHLNPVESDRHLTPVDNDLTLNPVENDLDSKLVDGERTLKSIDDDRKDSTGPIEKHNEITTTSTSPPKIVNPAENTIEFGDIINQTNVELRRLGWNAQKGKEYLLATYGKRSRQLLSDEELFEFLAYLKAQLT